MARLHYITDASGVELADGASSLSLDANNALVPAGWGDATRGIITEFDFHIWASGTAACTAMDLRAAVAHAYTIAATDIDSVDHTTETFTEAAHGWLTGDGPVQFTTTGTIPAGLSLLTDYYIIKTAANTFKVAASRADALAGTAVAITSNGTGTHTLTGGATCTRLHWHSADGLLGPDNDGAISLTNQNSYVRTIPHEPLIYAYALVGTVPAATVSSKLYPRISL